MTNFEHKFINKILLCHENYSSNPDSQFKIQNFTKTVSRQTEGGQIIKNTNSYWK